jgi:hypothetical protein
MLLHLANLEDAVHVGAVLVMVRWWHRLLLLQHLLSIIGRIAAAAALPLRGRRRLVYEARGSSDRCRGLRLSAGLMPEGC